MFEIIYANLLSMVFLTDLFVGICQDIVVVGIVIWGNTETGA